MLPSSIVAQILLVPFSSKKLDIIRLASSHDGLFHFRTAWELVHCSRQRDEVFFAYVAATYPSRVFFFLWQLLHGFLATDNALCLRGICMVSWCICDRVETSPHLFLDCPHVGLIQVHFWRNLGMRDVVFLTPHALLCYWRRCASTRSHI